MAEPERQGVHPPIAGVEVVELTMHPDERGVFTEIFRAEWGLGPEPVQWNLVSSRPGVLRGVHVHKRHSDYLVWARGHATIGLADLRPASPTWRTALTVELRADRLQLLVVPPGVAHGFYMHTESVHVYAVSCYWSTDDELGCRWNDADLGIPWPAAVREPLLSPRDQTLPSWAELMVELGTPFTGGSPAP